MLAALATISDQKTFTVRNNNHDYRHLPWLNSFHHGVALAHFYRGLVKLKVDFVEVFFSLELLMTLDLVIIWLFVR